MTGAKRRGGSNHFSYAIRCGGDGTKCEGVVGVEMLVAMIRVKYLEDMSKNRHSRLQTRQNLQLSACSVSDVACTTWYSGSVCACLAVAQPKGVADEGKVALRCTRTDSYNAEFRRWQTFLANRFTHS